MTHLPDPATFSRRGDQASAGRTRFVATGAQTRGDFGLFEVVMPPGGSGPGPHLHRTVSEAFHVLDLHADGRTPTTEEIDAFTLRHDQLNLRG
ncbi:hypothetical protein A7K94_0219075 [Modestobacter sp. VKM Ac-2676]|nr:hypothetical protein A7K94_0219075 [Modestobacter sp. VKM Ac-2676]